MKIQTKPNKTATTQIAPSGLMGFCDPLATDRGGILVLENKGTKRRRVKVSFDRKSKKLMVAASKEATRLGDISAIYIDNP